MSTSEESPPDLLTEGMITAKITTNNSNIIFGKDNLNKNIGTDSKEVNKKGMQDIKEQKFSIVLQLMKMFFIILEKKQNIGFIKL